MSLEAHARDVQSKLIALFTYLLEHLQQTSQQWKLNDIPSTLQEWALGSRRSETSLALLLLDYFLTTPQSNSSLFGKILVCMNGYNLLSFALHDKPSIVWKQLAGLSLPPGDAETMGALALGLVGSAGAFGVVSGVSGPSNHPFSVFSLALTKLILGFFVINKATTTTKAEEVLSLGRFHARTGVVVLMYAVLLVWRASRLRSKSSSDAPQYMQEMETRLTNRLDQLVTVVKDQKSRLDALAPSPMTPKKY